VPDFDESADDGFFNTYYMKNFPENLCNFLMAYIFVLKYIFGSKISHQHVPMDSANANVSKESILTKKPPFVGSTKRASSLI